MTKQIYWLRFRENYDIDAVDEICDKFCEAEQYYENKTVRFYGTAERLQEFIRAVKTVEPTVTYK